MRKLIYYADVKKLARLKTFSKTFSEKLYYRLGFLPNVEKPRKKSFEQEMI